MVLQLNICFQNNLFYNTNIPGGKWEENNCIVTMNTGLIT